MCVSSWLIGTQPVPRVGPLLSRDASGRMRTEEALSLKSEQDLVQTRHVEAESLSDSLMTYPPLLGSTK